MLKHDDRIQKLWFVFLAGYVLFSIHDYWLFTHNRDPNTYGRISIVFGAVAAFCLVYALNLGLKDRVMQFLGRYSLGIFAIHKYWALFLIVFFTKVFSILNISQFVTAFNILFSLIYFIVGVLAVALSLLCVRLLGHSRLREYVS